LGHKSFIKGKHNVIADALSRLERDEEEPQNKPTAQCMAAILTMCQCSSEELSFETLEMADNFSISVP
jgi:hypothetical protein